MKVVNRRHAREWSLQLLFQIDANPTHDLPELLADFWWQQAHLRHDENNIHNADDKNQTIERTTAPELVAPAKIRAFTEYLVSGVLNNRDAIDEKLEGYTVQWPLHRMGGVERNVLRLAIFEMFFDDQAPPVVIINEAVDLAKFFSSSESGRFVNGILDRACKDVTRPPRKATRRSGRRSRPHNSQPDSATDE